MTEDVLSDLREEIKTWRTPAREVQVVGLCKSYDGTIALDSVSATFRGGELCAIIGPNGAGKSTLLNVLFATTRPDTGTVAMDGRDITRWPSHARGRHGLIRSFQNALLALQLSSWENVALGALAHTPTAYRPLGPLTPVRSLRDAALRALEWVGLAHVADQPVQELSFGQRKRVALARCLAARPRFLALDEPLAGLDPDASAGVGRILHLLVAEGIGVLIVEHNMSFTFEMCDRVVVMAEGRLVLDGPAAEVQKDPRVIEVQLR